MTKIKEDARVHRRAVAQPAAEPAAETKPKAPRSKASDAKKHQNPKGGLNAAGRKHFGVKAPVKAGDNPRRASFLARMAGVSGPERDSKGRPTRLLYLSGPGGFFKSRCKSKGCSDKQAE